MKDASDCEFIGFFLSAENAFAAVEYNLGLEFEDWAREGEVSEFSLFGAGVT